MNRKPPEPVRRILRQEVNYCCPVPDCAEPFLTWHHFDPPWHVEQHHRPQGMIALCRIHHAQAEVGAFGKTEIRQWKSSPNLGELSDAKFDWYAKRAIIRLGGCYSVGECSIIMNGDSILSVTENDGKVCVSFILKNEENETLVEMDKNFFSFDSSVVHDLSVSASSHQIKAWLDERKVGFEIEFSRKTIEQWDALVQEDIPEKDERLTYPCVGLPMADLDEELRKIPTEKECVKWIGEFGYRAPGAVNPPLALLRWNVLQLMEDNKFVPLLNLKNCRLFNQGQLIEMRNGKLKFGSGLTSQFSFTQKLEISGANWGIG